jgi:ApaG protein
MYEITLGVKITVETQYQNEYSNPQDNEFSFAYRVVIENNNEHAIQLLSRKWRIFDSNFNCRYVEGEGVVGQQPVIQPGSQHAYMSGCNLNTEMGKMSGIYLMKNLHNNETFEVKIPDFELIAPCKNN